MNNLKNQILSLITVALVLQPHDAVATIPVDPLIEVSNNGLTKRGSESFKELQDTLLRMNDLSYNLVKGPGSFLDFAIDLKGDLEREGWIIEGYMGLEGVRNDYVDLSGIVAYHQFRNVMIIAYHGTASEINLKGWGTNLDGRRVAARQIPDEIRADFYEQMKGRTEGWNVLRSFLDGITAVNFDVADALELQDMIDRLVGKNGPDEHVRQELSTIIRRKTDLLRYVESGGCKFSGTVHRGMAKKFYSTKQEVLEKIQKFIKPLPPEKRQSLKIYFTGQSQAGATANLAFADLAINHGADLFGEGFRNQDWGTFYAYVLSAARLGDSTYVKWMHDNVGKDYFARQNVKGDPVPIVSGDSAMAKYLRELGAGVGEAFEQYAGFADAGHLLLDDGDETWARAQELYKSEGVRLDGVDAVNDAIHNLTAFLGYMAPDYIVSKSDARANGTYFGKIRSWANTTYVVIGTVLSSRYRSKLADIVSKRYAHLHYGHYRKGLGTVFDPMIVSRDIDRMLEFGDQHEAQRMQLVPYSPPAGA
jgi:hypothetical protein